MDSDETGPSIGRWRAVLLDLLMATMDSPPVWDAAAGSGRGLAWRDAVTRRMIAAGGYIPFETLVADAAMELHLSPSAPVTLFRAWHAMAPRPDASGLVALTVPYAFVTNASRRLAAIAAERSGLRPAFTLSAEEAGCYKPDPRIYLAACGRLGLQPAEVLFVAGAPYDAAGAQRAGLGAAWVRRRRDHEAPPGVREISTLDELGEGGQP